MANDVFATMFRNGAPQQFGLYYGAQGAEGPNEASWMGADQASLQRLQPYMNMSGAELQANWGSIPADLRAKLGNTPEEFASKISYAPDGQGGWQNTFKEKGEGLGDFILPALIAGVGGLSGGFGLGELFGGAPGGINASNDWLPNVDDWSSWGSSATDAPWGVNPSTDSLPNVDDWSNWGANPESGIPPVAPPGNAATGGYDYNDFMKSIGIDPAIAAGGGVADYATKLISALGGTKGLIGGALGGLLGGTSASSKPAGTTTTVQDIPDWLKPYVIGNLTGASGTQAGLLQNNGIMDAATAQYLKTLKGDYLDPTKNPYLDATYKHAADLVGSGVDSRFESAGRYGSGAHQGVLQEGMNNLATSIFGGNYQAERARQAAATGGAPTFQTGRAGAAYAPYSGFADLFPAGVRSTSTPYFSNTAGGILSGALAGSQLSRLFG